LSPSNNIEDLNSILCGQRKEKYSISGVVDIVLDLFLDVLIIILQPHHCELVISNQDVDFRIYKNHELTRYQQVSNVLLCLW
jgi:hypothetical protein